MSYPYFPINNSCNTYIIDLCILVELVSDNAQALAAETLGALWVYHNIARLS